jgi:hypothetical protein
MRLIRVAILAGVLPMVAKAQTAAVAKQCSMSQSAEWMTRQVSWFDESKHDWKDDTLRTALLQAAGLTAPLSAPVQFGVQVEGREQSVGSSANAMIARLTALAATRGSTWPTKSVVGASATHAVYLLALRDTGFARAALHRMMEAGPDESPAADVAALEDHMRLVWGRKQLYGTQFRAGANGALVLSPMEDSAHADMRREGAGLPPFAVGLCIAKTLKP